jgi:hypothetical protein
MDFATLITVFISSALVPWLANKGLSLDAAQSAWLSGAVVGTVTTVVHFFETKFKMIKAAPMTAPTPTVAQVVNSTSTLKSLLIVMALIAGGFLGAQDLTACATTTPSFNQLVSAAGQVDNTVLATVDSLVKSKSISSTQATAILAVADKVQAALTLANTANAAGQQGTAQAKLTAASAALAAIQGCLTAPSTLTVCLQGVSAP